MKTKKKVKAPSKILKIPAFKNLEKMNLPLMDFVKEYIVKKSLLRGKIGGKL